MKVRLIIVLAVLVSCLFYKLSFGFGQGTPVYEGDSIEDCAEHCGVSLSRQYQKMETQNYIHHRDMGFEIAIVFANNERFFFLIKGNTNVHIAFGQKDGHYLMYKVDVSSSSDYHAHLYQEMVDELKTLLDEKRGRQRIDYFENN